MCAPGWCSRLFNLHIHDFSSVETRRVDPWRYTQAQHFLKILFWRGTLRPHSNLYHATNIYIPSQLQDYYTKQRKAFFFFFWPLGSIVCLFLLFWGFVHRWDSAAWDVPFIHSHYRVVNSDLKKHISQQRVPTKKVWVTLSPEGADWSD